MVPSGTDSGSRRACLSPCAHPIELAPLPPPTYHHILQLAESTSKRVHLLLPDETEYDRAMQM